MGIQRYILYMQVQLYIFFSNSFDILIPHTLGHLIAQSIILVFLKKSLTFRSDTRDITVNGSEIHYLDQRSAQCSF